MATQHSEGRCSLMATQPQPPPVKPLQLIEGQNPKADAILQSVPEPWANATYPDNYRLTRQGLYHKLHPVSKEGEVQDDEPPQLKRLCGPLWVSAMACNPSSEGWGIFCEWIDLNGQRHGLAVGRERLHDVGRDLIKDLARRGLDIEPGKEAMILKYLARCHPQKRLIACLALGWQEGTIPAFVLPHQTLQLPNDTAQYVFQPEHTAVTQDTLKTQGTLKQWQQEIAIYASGNPAMVFALCVALAGPLLKWVGLDSGGFHFYGHSSKGKTTLAQVAASVWGHGGDPAVDSKAFTRRWNTTDNGLEGLAAAHNDTLLVLDELGTCASKDFGSLVYGLMGGMGKTRMTREAALRTQKTWCLHVISTGEISARQKMEETSKGSPKAGQLLRLIDIPIPDNGLFPCTHDREAKPFVEGLKQACGQTYGTAGPSFIRALLKETINNPDHRQDYQNALTNNEISLSSHDQLSETLRVIRRFAVVQLAGQMAVEWGILPLLSDDIDHAVQSIFALWQADFPALNDGERGVLAIREFLLKHPDRICTLKRDPASELSPVRNLAGYKDEQGRYLLTESGFKEACQGLDQKSVLNTLKVKGLLHQNNGAKNKSKATPYGSKSGSFYAIESDILSLDEDS